MKRFQNSQKRVYGKFYVQKIAAVDLSKSYFLKNAKKTCKPNNHYLNRDWVKAVVKLQVSAIDKKLLLFFWLIQKTVWWVMFKLWHEE